jgi:hypothetical protein
MSGPMGGYSVGPGMPPHGHPYAQQPMAPPGWRPQAAPAPLRGGFKLSRQIIVLAIVGFICIGIFITGIVLFATTKF